MTDESEERFKRIDASLERTGKTIERTKMIMQGEQIYFNHKKLGAYSRHMTIYLDKLTGEQKQELERIEKVLFDMAQEVTEEGTRTLKSIGDCKERP